MVLPGSKLNTLHEEVDQLFGAITKLPLTRFKSSWSGGRGYGPEADFRQNEPGENSAKPVATALSLSSTSNFSLSIRHRSISSGYRGFLGALEKGRETASSVSSSGVVGWLKFIPP
jgi:hypothetical protein